MRILSLKEAAEAFNTPNLESFLAGIDWQYPDPVHSYFLPKDSGGKIGLARVLTNTFLDHGPALLWITATGIWPSAEHMDLFVRYRLSYGETRTLVQAPVHTFESKNERDAFMSILCLALFFVWDAEIMSQDRSLAITVSHDEWIEYRFAPGHQSLVSYLDKYFGSFSTKAR